MNKMGWRIWTVIAVMSVALIVGACTDLSKFSKDPVAVQVKTYDLVGSTVAGATVLLLGDEDFGPLQTGPDGIATIENVTPGTYTMRVWYPDGPFFERTVPVWGGSDVVVAIEPTSIPLRLVVDGQLNPGLNIQLHGYGNDPAVEPNNIGYNFEGRWFTLDFTVPEGAAGIYRMIGYIAGPDADGSTEYFIDGESLGVVYTRQTGGWQNYWHFTLFPEIELSEGVHTMRLYFVTSGRNYHSFHLIPVKLFN